ncbi:MAG: L,D-transpeptidase [Devosiaceae bacterium]|nr:L,D-transpeptidase [Devosiaceae bacterium]
MFNLSFVFSAFLKIFSIIVLVLAFSSAAFAGGKKIYYPPPVGMSLTKSTPTNGLALQLKNSVNPKFIRQVVPYNTSQRVGTIIVETSQKYLYLVLRNGKAMRYGIGVGREGFGWSGTHRITAKRKWPGWTPPAAMRKRQPELPAYMPGGIDNPLGARALYIGSTLYRLHGTSEVWSIGRNVSSGCIRLLNEDVIDLYNRARVGAKVIVM